MSLVTIRHYSPNDITWLPSASADFDLAGHTDIWRINITDNLVYLDDLSTLINTGETERANKYFQVRDRNRFIISRGALRIILGRYLNLKPASVEFEIGPNKKPFIKASLLHYNVSHSGDWIIIAVANSQVGADVEQLDPAFDYQDIINEYFSPEEADHIRQNDTHSSFFLLWTRKEALTKATGKGLDDDLKFIPALNGEHSISSELLKSSSNWTVNSFELSDGYSATFAVEGTTHHVRFRDILLSKNSL